MSGSSYDQYVATVFGTDPSSYSGGQQSGDAGLGGFDADSFYQQSLQDSGYSLGTNDCLDQCWADFRRCLDHPPNDNPQACLAQLTACQRSCGSQQQDTSGGTGDSSVAEGGQTSGFDADSFYQQSLQDSGYSLGTNDCLDQCWADFRRCLDNPPNDNPQACLAQLTACQRSCGTQQQDASGTTGDTGTTEAKEAEADGAQDSGGNADSDQTSGDSGSQGTDGSNQIQVTLITSYGQAVRYWIQDKATDYNNETAPGQGKTLVDGDAHGPGERITVTCTETANGASVCYKRESYPYPPGGGETPWTSALISAGGEHDMIL